MENNKLPPPPPSYEELVLEEKIKKNEKYRLDPTKEYGELQFSFSYNGIGFAPIGDIQVIKAAQKSGKTFFVALLAGALLKGEYMGIKSLIDYPKILIIDTEQHPRNTQKVYRRICFIAGLNGHTEQKQLDVLHTRGAQTQEQMEILENEISIYHPNVIFIDGIVDYVNDSNDLKESKDFITCLSKIALENECSIWSVLHTNPNTDKMRGHLGTITAQKVSDVFQCSKIKEGSSVIFNVEQTDTRNKDIDNFSFALETRVDGNELIVIPVKPYISDKTKSEINILMQNIFNKKEEKAITWQDLKDEVMEECGVKKTAASERIRTAITYNIIKHNEVTNKYSYSGVSQE